MKTFMNSKEVCRQLLFLRDAEVRSVFIVAEVPKPISKIINTNYPLM